MERSGRRKALCVLLFLVCVAVSFLLKTCHYNMEAARVAEVIGDAKALYFGDFRDALPLKRPNFMPYTIESAMMFAYAKDVADGKGVPARDPRLAYLPEVPPYAQMNMTLEWVLGWGYRVWSAVFPPEKPSPEELRYQDDPAFAAYCAWNVRLWTALIPGLIFLWLVSLRTPLFLAFSGGMIHAVSVAAIARATGQDIVRGDLCIPLILLSMVLVQSYYGNPRRWKLPLLFVAVFGCFTAWDHRGAAFPLENHLASSLPSGGAASACGRALSDSSEGVADDQHDVRHFRHGTLFRLRLLSRPGALRGTGIREFSSFDAASGRRSRLSDCGVSTSSLVLRRTSSVRRSSGGDPGDPGRPGLIIRPISASHAASVRRCGRTDPAPPPNRDSDSASV